MTEFFKKISAVGLSFFMLSACSAGENETVTTTMTSESAAVTETETSIETESTTTAETTTADTVSETTVETVAEASAESYVPDRNFEYTENFMSQEDKYINRPMFLGEPDNTGAEVYVKFTGDDAEDNYVIIKHDGGCDEIQTVWMGRWCLPPQLFSGDYDGDGENEIATVRYAAGGTLCRIFELTVFDKENGHYNCYFLNDYEFVENNVSWNINNETDEVTFSVCGEEYIYDISEKFPDGVNEIFMGNLNDYTIIDNEIFLSCGVCVENINGVPEYGFDIKFDVEYADGVFELSAPQFIEDVE